MSTTTMSLPTTPGSTIYQVKLSINTTQQYLITTADTMYLTHRGLWAGYTNNKHQFVEILPEQITRWSVT